MRISKVKRGGKPGRLYSWFWARVRNLARQPGVVWLQGIRLQQRKTRICPVGSEIFDDFPSDRYSALSMGRLFGGNSWREKLNAPTKLHGTWNNVKRSVQNLKNFESKQEDQLKRCYYGLRTTNPKYTQLWHNRPNHWHY